MNINAIYSIIILTIIVSIFMLYNTNYCQKRRILKKPFYAQLNDTDIIEVSKYSLEMILLKLRNRLSELLKQPLTPHGVEEIEDVLQTAIDDTRMGDGLMNEGARIKAGSYSRMEDTEGISIRDMIADVIIQLDNIMKKIKYDQLNTNILNLSQVYKSISLLEDGLCNAKKGARRQAYSVSFNQTFDMDGVEHIMKSPFRNPKVSTDVSLRSNALYSHIYDDQAGGEQDDQPGGALVTLHEELVRDTEYKRLGGIKSPPVFKRPDYEAMTNYTPSLMNTTRRSNFKQEQVMKYDIEEAKRERIRSKKNNTDYNCKDSLCNQYDYLQL